jgi:hypothetical protein
VADPAKPANPVIVRNSRMVLACIILFALASLFIAGCMVLETSDLLFLQRGHIFLRLLAAAQWALGGVSIAWIGVASWKLALAAGFHQVRLETDGVHFRLGTKRKPFKAFFASDQIASVIHQRRTSNQYIFVSGKDGTSVNYTAYDIFRYKKLARQIAAHAGVPFTELKAAKPQPRAGKTPTS